MKIEPLRSLKKLLEGFVSRMKIACIMIQNFPNKDVFQDLPSASTKRRLTFIGHCLRSDQSSPQPVTQILLWEPNTGRKHGKGCKMTYLKRILEDTQREKQYLFDDVRDRVEWRKFFKRLL